MSIMQTSANTLPLSPHSQSSFALHMFSNIIKQKQKTSNRVRNIIKTHVHILSFLVVINVSECFGTLMSSSDGGWACIVHL